MPAPTVLAGAVCAAAPPRPGWVAVRDGVIEEVGEGRPPRGARDLGDHVLAPGYIDLQINGVGPIGFSAADPDSWRDACIQVAQHGVTSVCPTFVSAPLDTYSGFLTRMGAARAAAPPGASAIVGAHLEGPFLGGAPGAHQPDLLRTADLPWITELLTGHPGLVRIVTLAPEADPGFVLTRALCDTGVVVALGHSTAPYGLAIDAAAAGATVVTHLFNGMGPLHHREPGLVGAALDDDRLTPTLIADLVHVHPAALRLAIESKRNVALVSDVVASSDAALSEAVRLPDGRLAGATALLDRAVANVVSLGVPIERATEMASAVPAQVLGLSDRGQIAVGARADLVALAPETWAVHATWIAGEPVAGREEI